MRTLITFGTTTAITLLFAATVNAQTLYDWSSTQAPVVIHDGGTLFFIGKDKTVWRVYKWAPPKGKELPSAFFTDLDGDGKPDIVGSGKPTFALDHDGNPRWFHTAGCTQAMVANTWGDRNPEVVCLSGRTLSNHTFDWQDIWSISLGQTWTSCMVGDVNGDLKADIECAISGTKRVSRIDGQTGEVLAATADTAELTESLNPSITAATSALEGNQTFDLNGDGTKSETLTIDGNTVVVRAGTTVLATLNLSAVPTGAIVKDLDGDKKPEVIAVSKSKVAIWSFGDEKPAVFALTSSSYRRAPVAQLESVYANGFEDNTAAQATVNGLSDKLANCYASQVRANQFAGVGRALLSVNVDNAGKVTGVERTHSEIADSKVVTCAQGVLKAGKYPKATDATAAVNITITFTFRDQ